MILAAGRGERMRPLTDQMPKPLLQVAGKALIQYHVERLAEAGFTELVINHAWCGEQIENFLGDGSRFGVGIVYSAEEEALETAGGIIKALPLLGEEAFLLVNGDIWTDYSFSSIKKFSTMQDKAHLVMVNNPTHHAQGDYCLTQDDRLSLKDTRADAQNTLTYSGIAVLHPQLFADLKVKKMPLAPLFEKAIKAGQVSGERFSGQWSDIGTAERLQELNKYLQTQA